MCFLSFHTPEKVNIVFLTIKGYYTPLPSTFVNLFHSSLLILQKPNNDENFLNKVINLRFTFKL